MTIKDRSNETMRDWLMGQLVKPVDACLWCGQTNWYKKKGVAWYCGSCDPEDKLLTWPERLELIRSLRANRDDLEELNALPNISSLSSVTWSAIKRIAYPDPVEDPPSDECPPVGLRGCEIEDDTDKDDSGPIAKGDTGTTQPRTTDERLDKDQEQCQKRPTNFPGVMSRREKLLSLKNRLVSFTTEEKQEMQNG